MSIASGPVRLLSTSWRILQNLLAALTRAASDLRLRLPILSGGPDAENKAGSLDDRYPNPCAPGMWRHPTNEIRSGIRFSYHRLDAERGI